MDTTALSRRGFISGAVSGLAGAVIACSAPAAQQRQGGAAGQSGGRILLKGGCVLSLDPQVGDFDVADVLIEGTRISAVRPNIDATADVIDCANMIVMPGFVDTHRHMWQGVLRNVMPNGLLSDYVRDIIGIRTHYRPEDVRIGNLVTALGALNAGVTNILDWSHIANSPEHADAAVEGLRQSGIRAVYGFGSGAGGPSNRYPQDIRRLRKQHFSSDDQLLTLALGGNTDPCEWAAAREVGASISVHAGGSLSSVANAPRSRRHLHSLHDVH